MILTSLRETLTEQLHSVPCSRAESNRAEILMLSLLREKTAENLYILFLNVMSTAWTYELAKAVY